MRLAIDERVDLSGTLEDSIIQLRKDVPQELVVSMFQKLVRFLFLYKKQPKKKRRLIFMWIFLKKKKNLL